MKAFYKWTSERQFGLAGVAMRLQDTRPACDKLRLSITNLDNVYF